MVKKIHKHIEIIRSTTNGLSSLNKTACMSIYELLNKHYDTVGITVINNLSDIESLITKQPDLVFMGLKFVYSDTDNTKIWISDYLDNLGISYTGSRREAQELARNKELAKHCVHAAGINTASFKVIKCSESYIRNDIELKYPVFIKPTNRGGGFGIDDASVANDFKALKIKVSSIHNDFHADALIEEYLSGREFSVAILGSSIIEDYSIMPLELIAPLNSNNERILSAKVKHSDTEIFTKVIDTQIYKDISELALQVFNALGAKDYGRIDIRYDANGKPHFLEANLLPNLTKNYGNFPKACTLNAGIKYEDMILQIVRLGLARQEETMDSVIAPILNTLFTSTAVHTAS